MAEKHVKTRQVSLGSRCLVSMNFCLIFLIRNSGHCLIRIIIQHNIMLFVNLSTMTEASASICLILATALLARNGRILRRVFSLLGLFYAAETNDSQ